MITFLDTALIDNDKFWNYVIQNKIKISSYKKAIKQLKKEPEYKKTPPLKISSVGTENTKKKVGRIPYGCALLTSTGSTSSLKSQGIDYIVHATPMPEGSNSLESFVAMAAKAIQNSIILAGDAHSQFYINFIKLWFNVNPKISIKMCNLYLSCKQCIEFEEPFDFWK